MISVVIPAYNSEMTIKDCIDSVLSQSRVDLVEEIIVVNDGSSDNTATMIQKVYSNEKLVKIISKENGGVSSARNAGIKAARGDWIALLDSDDVWLPEKLEKQWAEIERNHEIVFIGCNRNQENLRYGTKAGENLYTLNIHQLLIKMWPHTSTALIRKDVFQTIGYFNEQMRYAEDGEMWNRIALRYPLYYISESLEIAGGNKNTFGESGLSANLKGMYEGNVRNISQLHLQKDISTPFFLFLRSFYWVKYLRRIFITEINRKEWGNNSRHAGRSG